MDEIDLAELEERAEIDKAREHIAWWQRALHQESTWIDGHGTVHRIDAMEDRHRLNVMAFLRRNARTAFFYAVWLPPMYCYPNVPTPPGIVPHLGDRSWADVDGETITEWLYSTPVFRGLVQAQVVANVVRAVDNGDIAR